jgi:DNA-binding PadR family transcriptional regulator
MPPVFAHGALRLYLLALLESGPKHGYELIKALKDRFGGTYSPSAGTIYPRLGKLEDNGLVTTERAGRRTNYRITAAGLAELDRRREDLAGLEKDIAASVQRLDVEVMLQKFRDELCADLRGQALRRPISPVTLETVRTALDEARAAIRSTLQS